MDECREHGEGYVTYLWPKPMSTGLSDWQPKISYVKLFPKWNWVVGTGVYVDDIELSVQKRLDAILEEVRQTLDKVRISQNGYMFIFNSQHEMLIHPVLKRLDVREHVNPATGNFILDDFINAAHTPDKVLEYLWDKPPAHRGEYRFKKHAYCVYFEPLDWYIGASLYIDDIEEASMALRRKIAFLTIIFMGISIGLSLLLSGNLSRPLYQLAQAAKEIKAKGIHGVSIPVAGTLETKALGYTLREMIQSIQQAQAELKEREEKYRSLIELTDTGYVLLDGNNGKIVDANQTYLKLTGFETLEQVLGHSVLEWTAEHDRRRNAQAVEQCLSLGYIRNFEVDYRQPDGEIVPVDVNACVVTMEGKPIIHALVRDMTQRKQAQQALHQSEAKYRALFDMTADAMTVIDGERFVEANDAAVRLLRALSKEEIIGMTPWDLSPPVQPDGRYSRERGLEVIERAYKVGSLRLEWLHKRMDDTVFPADITLTAVPMEGKHVLHIVWRDITDRKKAEESLRQSEEKFRRLVENLHDEYFLYSHRPDGTFTYISPSITKILGYAPSEMIASYESYLTENPINKLAKERTREVLKGVNPGPYELEAYNKDHQPVLLEVVETPVLDAQGNVVALEGIAHDITLRKRAELELKHERDFSQTIIQASPAFVVAIGLDGKTIMMNQAMLSALGYHAQEVVGKDYISSFVPEEHRPILANVFEHLFSQPQGTANENIILTKDGRRLTVEWHGRLVYREDGQPDYIIGIGLDITERKQAQDEQLRLEAQVQHSQKLESLGVLAGGIAHDFNNMLMAILGNAELAIEESNPECAAFENLVEIESTAQRAADLCKQMLAYSGKGKFVIENINISDVVEDMIKMLEISISKKARLHCDLPRDLPSIEGDVTQMRQIVLNLITNASESLGDSEGEISICTGVKTCGVGCLQETYFSDGLVEGPYVFIQVRDTGCGLDEQAKAKLFDPFYSTKATGRGLGLSAVLGIVRGHRGTIEVNSELGKGTVFTVYLPACDKPLTAEPVTPESTIAETRPVFSGCILLVEDESAVRTVANQMLARLGFTVLMAEDGVQALDVFEKNASVVSCILLDLTMPRMGGEEVFRTLRRSHPDLRFIIASGYNEQEISATFADESGLEFIQKPYRMNLLAEKLSKLLNLQPHPSEG